MKLNAFNSKFLTSPRSIEIKEVIDAHKGKKPLTQIYKLIKEIDKKIPQYASFVSFMRSYDNSVQTMRRNLAKDIIRDALSEVELVNAGVKQGLKLGNLVMDSALKDVKEKLKNKEQLSFQEKREIMNWFRTANQNYFEGQTLKLKQTGNLNDSMALSMLARAARSGALKPEEIDFVDGEFSEANQNQLNEHKQET